MAAPSAVVSAWGCHLDGPLEHLGQHLQPQAAPGAAAHGSDVLGDSGQLGIHPAGFLVLAMAVALGVGAFL
jgi:hypothetical protein